MKITDFEEMQRDFQSGVYNLTDNGKCTGCGGCCSNLLPMTDEEIAIIRKYIKRNGIKEHKHLVPLKKPSIDITCPFLNDSKSKDKCTIYEVRPAICRCFICSEPNGALKHKELFEGVRKVVNVRGEFYG